ncbi:MAG: hypothetical protein ACJARS_005184, partial [bacterium]
MMWLLALTAMAADLDLPGITDALAQELQRNATELTLEGAPPIYFARYRALFMEQVDVRARFGSVIRTSTSPYR